MKKKILAAVLMLFALYGGWLIYETLSFRPYANPEAWDIGRDPHEIEGVYHIHSKFSDGTASVEDIARSAAKQKLDFILLTDHGNPNVRSVESQGWKNGVLVLAGSELSVNRGHLVALGFRLPSQSFSRRAEDAVAEVAALGGFTVIAHPYSKVKWTWGDTADYAGLEIINADTMFKDNLSRILPYLPLIAFRSRLPLIKMIERPEANLKKWDQRNAKSPVFGYFSTDAHFYYPALLSLLRLHVLLDKPLERDFAAAASQVHFALRHGRFYNAIEAVAGARGFRFEATDGRQRYPMGETAPAKAGMRLEVRAPFPLAKEIRLIHNGRTIMASGLDILKVPAEEDGFYRVEVFLKECSPLEADTPWIISNPIYLRKDGGK